MSEDEVESVPEMSGAHPRAWVEGRRGASELGDAALHGISRQEGQARCRMGRDPCRGAAERHDDHELARNGRRSRGGVKRA